MSSLRSLSRHGSRQRQSKASIFLRPTDFPVFDVLGKLYIHYTRLESNTLRQPTAGQLPRLSPNSARPPDFFL